MEYDSYSTEFASESKIGIQGFQLGFRKVNSSIQEILNQRTRSKEKPVQMQIFEILGRWFEVWSIAGNADSSNYGECALLFPYFRIGEIVQLSTFSTMPSPIYCAYEVMAYPREGVFRVERCCLSTSTVRVLRMPSGKMN